MNGKYNFEYLHQNGITTLEDLVGRPVFFVFPSQGVVSEDVRKIEYTSKCKEWFFVSRVTHRIGC